MLVALVRLVRALPAGTAVLLTRFLVLTYLLGRPDYRREIAANSELVLGRRLSWARNGWRVARNLALMARSTGSAGQIFVDSACICGDNSWQLFLERDLHTVMASFHFGAWEYLPRVFRRQSPGVRVVTGRQRSRALDAVLTESRQEPKVKVVQTGEELLGGLEGPGITGFMLDNTSQGRRTRVECERFDMAIPNAAFRLGRPVFPMFAWFEGKGLKVRAFPPGDERAAVDALLTMVRERPEEWVFWGKAGAVRRKPRDQGNRAKVEVRSENAEGRSIVMKGLCPKDK